MKNELIADIVDWDVNNWSKALDFWENKIDILSAQNTCLELGSRKGGLSMWLAINDNTVVCSDLESPKKYASELHSKYSCQDNIEYKSIDATNINLDNKFDIVIFKSIIGGISSNGKNDLKKKTIDEIYKCLKPNGKLLFAENLESSIVHKFFRKIFVKWGSRWNYLKYNEIGDVFNSFEKIEYETVGFLGAFGRTEKQRRILGRIDDLINVMIPKNKRYIIYGVAIKAPTST